MKLFTKILIAWLLFSLTAAEAIKPRDRVLLLSGGIPSWVVNPTNPPDIMFNFSTNQAFVKATDSTVQASSLITTNRASTGYVNDSNGNWTLIGSNLPRMSNLGLLVEEGRTNSIRNNSMQGAIVGADNVELTTNGNFAAQGAGWTAAGTVTFTAGQAAVTGNGVDNTNNIAQLITGLVVGRSYIVSISATNGAGANAYVGTSPGNGSVVNNVGLASNGFASNSPDRFGFTATATSHWVTISRIAVGTITLTSVSVQDGERTENFGFPANPINAAQNTVQNGWQWNNNAGTGTVVYNSGPQTVTLTGDGTHGAALGSAAIPTIAGQTYTVTADVTVNNSTINVGTAAFGNTLLNVATAVGTGQKFQFTATTTTSFVSFAKTGAVGSTIDNVSVQSAGTVPTNWADAGGSDTGLIRTVVGLGVALGTMDTIDINWSGTANGTSRRLSFENATQIAAVYGQVWVNSFWAAQVAGSLTNVTGVFQLLEENTSGGSLVNEVANNITGGISGTLQRFQLTDTPTGSTVGALQPRFGINITNGAAVNVTVRLGWPQLENAGSFLIVGTSSAVKAADGTGGVNGTAVYQVGGGTVATSATTLNVTWASGVMTVNSVANAGGYSPNGYPTSPAPLTFVSGTATGWTGATVTLTPGQVTAASVTASSPIRTTSVAVTRSPDTVTRSATFGAAYTMWSQGTPLEPPGSLQSMFSVSVDSSNRSAMRRQSGTSLPSLSVSGGTGVTIGSLTVHNTGVDGKYATAMAAGDQAFSFAGDIHTASAAALPNTPTTMTWGPNSSTASFYWNGFVEKSALWLTQRVPNAQLQSITK